jgi:integrase
MQFFASPDFQRLDPRSQRVLRGRLESTFLEPIAPGRDEVFADFPLSRMTSKAIRVLRDRVSSNTPEAANNRVKAIRRVFAWGVENELVKANVARDVKLISTGSEGFHTWTDAEVEQFEARHPVGTKARLALTLLLLTGVRRSDVVLLGRQHVRSGSLRFTQQKNRKRRPVTIELPVLPALQRVIDASETGDLAFLVTQYGKPFTAAGFGNWFRDRCNEAGLPQCSAHGLRKAGATRAAENLATPHELMALFGWLTLKQAEHYTRAASQKRLAAGAVAKLQRTENGTKVPHSGRE